MENYIISNKSIEYITSHLVMLTRWLKYNG